MISLNLRSAWTVGRMGEMGERNKDFLISGEGQIEEERKEIEKIIINLLSIVCVWVKDEVSEWSEWCGGARQVKKNEKKGDRLTFTDGNLTLPVSQGVAGDIRITDEIKSR